MFNPFHSNVILLLHLETSMFSDDFRGCKNGAVASNRLKPTLKTTDLCPKLKIKIPEDVNCYGRANLPNIFEKFPTRLWKISSTEIPGNLLSSIFHLPAPFRIVWTWIIGLSWLLYSLLAALKLNWYLVFDIKLDNTYECVFVSFITVSVSFTLPSTFFHDKIYRVIRDGSTFYNNNETINPNIIFDNNLEIVAKFHL